MDFVTRTPKPIPGIRESETEDRLEYCSELRDAIGCLPRLQRLVLLADLVAQGTAPADELAAKFGTTRSSIYVSRSNGRRALFAILKERGHLRVGAPKPQPARNDSSDSPTRLDQSDAGE